MQTFYIIILLTISAIIGIEFNITNAIIEIFFGFLGVNFLGIDNEIATLIKILAEFGMLSLMFLIGYEIDVKIIKSHIKPIVKLGFYGFFPPFILGALIFFFFLKFPLLNSIVIGLAVSNTSSALIYSFLKFTNLLSKDTGQIILGATMVIDLLSLTTLMFTIEKIDIYFILGLTSLIIVFYLIIKLANFLFYRYSGNIVELEIRFMLLLILGMKAISEMIHIDSAILAFILGALFANLVNIEERELLEVKYKSMVFSFFAPLFFFYSGSKILLKNVDLQTIGFIILFLAIGIIGKSAVLFPLRKIFPKKEKLFFWVLNFRLLFTIIVSLVAYEKGFINIKIFNALILFVIIINIILTIILKFKVKEELI